MFDTVVIATDGSRSAARAVDVALDVAGRFDAAVHALYVVDERELAGAPDDVRADLRRSLEDLAEDALAEVRPHGSVTTTVRDGRPPTEITRYADEVDADAVVVGTRGRHGDHAYLLGSVAEAVVRRCSRPVLTVRQLDGTDAGGESRPPDPAEDTGRA